MNFKQQLKSALAKAISQSTALAEAEILKVLEQPKNPEHGDLAFPCFMLAKATKSSPADAANKLANEISLPKGISKVSQLGPFLNFCFDRNILISSALSIISTEASKNKEKTIIVEYSSPNIAKPFHVGHLRATLIGNCLDRVYRRLGYNTISVNHLGDWGTQFGFVWAGCELWGKPKNNSVIELLDIYRRATDLKVEQETDKNSKDSSTSKNAQDINSMARQFFVDLEDNKPYATEFWKWCREISLDYLKKTYSRLGVKFDHYTGESFYSDLLVDVKNEIEAAGLLKESQGALGVELSPELGFARIYTPDGRSLYLTRDIATALYRAKTFAFDKAVYVVGAPQSLHFQQLKALLHLLKKPFAERIVHASFGHVLGMKTRGGGEFIELNSFLDEAYDRALNAYNTQVSKRPEGLDETVVARAVALAAIVFSNLSRNRIKDVHFSWDSALEFQGDSGPYVLYAYARINGIKEKALAAGVTFSDKINSALLVEESAYQLANVIFEFDQILNLTVEESEPAVLASYALNLSKAVAKAYLDLKVVGIDTEIASARMALFERASSTLREVIELLGMTALERM
jgi:arginyl-tRNA synthetase